MNAKAQVRVVAPDALPTAGPPTTLAQVVTWASWLTVQTATGAIDAITARELNRSLVTLKSALEKADLAATQKEHERTLKQLKRDLAQKGRAADD